MVACYGCPTSSESTLFISLKKTLYYANLHRETLSLEGRKWNREGVERKDGEMERGRQGDLAKTLELKVNTERPRVDKGGRGF